MKIAIIGQGYVGLTLTSGLATANHEVTGFDLNEMLIQDLRRGETYVPGIDGEKLIDFQESGELSFTTDPTHLNDNEIIVIAVPTPLDAEGKPNLEFILSACRMISENVTNECLIINESTSYPGTLRLVIKKEIEKYSKVNFKFAAAPERVDPGNPTWNLGNTPRLVSGLDDEATSLAKNFYLTVCEEVIIVSSPEVAETSKLFENTFRQVNIALVNELAQITSKLNVSSNEVVEAAATKPFGFMKFNPSIGVGGHCIPIDPIYLSFIANKNGASAYFIEHANKINLEMPKYVASRIISELKKPLSESIIQIAGIAYKPNVSDIRESPALSLIKSLRQLGAEVIWCDPLVQNWMSESSTELSTNIDLGLIVSPHKEINFDVWKKGGTKVFDLSANSQNFGWAKFL